MADNVPLFVYELAHKVRAALDNPRVRNRVIKTLRDTIAPQRLASNEISSSQSRQRNEHIDALKAIYRGECESSELPPLPDGTDPYKATPNSDWPFQTEHGLDDEPGCILHLAAINDYAAQNPQHFVKLESNEPKQFTELVESDNFDALGWYHSYWVWRVEKLGAQHEDRLRTVIEGALNVLRGTRTVLQKPKGILARDKWIYDQCCVGEAYSKIRLSLKQKPACWPRISTDNGIKQAAKRYSEQNKLALPPARKNGRPKDRNAN